MNNLIEFIDLCQKIISLISNIVKLIKIVKKDLYESKSNKDANLQFSTEYEDKKKNVLMKESEFMHSD